MQLRLDYYCFMHQFTKSFLVFNRLLQFDKTRLDYTTTVDWNIVQQPLLAKAMNTMSVQKSYPMLARVCTPCAGIQSHTLLVRLDYV